MPIMDGYKSTENILAYYENMSTDPRYSHIKKPSIFGMTSIVLPKYSWITERCKQVGMRGMLFKPVAKKGLAQTIEKCLGSEYLIKDTRREQPEKHKKEQPATVREKI